MARHADGSYVLPDNVTEDQERGMRAEAAALRAAIGPEAFEAFLVSLATENESWLRENDTDNPILEVLDEHRSKAKLGFDS